MEQSEKTIKFNKLVKSLVDSGTVKNYAQIIDDLDWNKSMMSSVTNGVKNVPNDVYRKFLKVYQLSDEESKDEKIAAQEAAIRVIFLELVNLKHLVTGEPVSKVHLDLEAAIKQAIKR